MTEPTFTQLQLIADRTTDWQFHCWYWGDAIAIDGMMQAHDVGAGSYQDHVMMTLDRWYRHCTPNFDDALAPGRTIIGAIMRGDLPPGAGDRVLDLLEGLPLAYGIIPAVEPHRLSFRFGVCIDAVYHLPSFYARASQWKGQPQLAQKAIRIALDSMRVLHCGSGWSQWYDRTHRRNNGVAWTRGLGWAVLGLLDLVEVLESQGTQEVEDLAAKVLQRLADTQSFDGNWLAVLDHPLAESETSTAAYYVAAAMHPAAARLVALPSVVLDRAVAACQRALAADGTFTGVTADVLPSWDIKTYERCPTEPSPWAQGVALRAFAAMTRQQSTVATNGSSAR